jgi:transposase-like protein
MKWKKHSPEEIVDKLARVRAAARSGVQMTEAIKAVGISEATYFRWRAQYGNLGIGQLEQLKRLELENARLRKALDELDYAASA